MIYTVTLNPALDRELTVSEIIENEVLRASRSQVDFGGKGFNVSRMISSLGGQSVAVGFVGGKCGEMLQDGLIAVGIRTEFVWLPEETRTNVSIVTNGRYIKVNEAGPALRDSDFRALIARIESLAKPNDWWVLAGSLPPGAPEDAYARITAVLKKRKANIFLDSSGKPLAKGSQAGPHWVKPNETELEQITGETDPIKGAFAMQYLGVQNVALTLGNKGAFLVSGEQIWRGFPPAIVEKNPIGAGDSFLGGLVWSLSQDMPQLEAFQWGLACGAATAEQPGTTVGQYNRVSQLKEQVHVEEMTLQKKI
ncbi:MAG: 1-phosphofructokinase family hexose kinase [Chloroflexota bacterium]